MKQKRVPPQRRQPEKRRVPTQRRSPLTFTVNVIFFDKVQGKTVFLEAGKPSPFYDLVDVPAKLQAHVGSPEDAIAQSNEIQRVVPRVRLQQEEEELEMLNTGARLDPEVKRALDERGSEYLRDVR